MVWVRAWVLAAVLVTRVARADEIDDVVAQGEALAKQAEWTRAIAAFKQADAKRPRAKHACLIGLAYTRRELWAEAEVFLSVCKQRANTDDPAPDWLDEAQRTLAEKLSAAGAAPISITVEPPEAIALVSVSTFAPDETFAPRTIHLTPGSHTISAAAPGFKPAKQEITIASGAPADVRLVLVPEHPRATPPAATHSRVPLYVIAAGAAVALGGLAFDQFALQPAADKLNVKDNYQYELIPKSDFDTFHTRRDVTIGLFATGAALIVTGAVLNYTVFRDREPVRVGAAIAPGTAMLTLEVAP
jgi:hypothetical protein